MLQPERIPQSEPLIDVGIVLPEDQFQQISITIPHAPLDTLITTNGQKFLLEPGSELLFQQNNGQIITFFQNSSFNAKEFVVASENSGALRKQPGFFVQGVIAGRNFHWQKKIDVYLPGSIRVFVHENNLILVNRLPFEQYVTCVATSEMSADCPQAFLEAQTVAARSWMLANVEQKHRRLGMDVCNDDCCQRYQGSTFLTQQAMTAAKATRGKVLLFDGKICDARYSKSCGGMMEAFEAIWSGEAHPYLQVKPDAAAGHVAQNIDLTTEAGLLRWIEKPPSTYCSPQYMPENELQKYLGNVDEQGKYFRWTYSILQQEMTAHLNEKLDLQAKHIVALRPLARGGSGRLIKLCIEYLDSHSQHREYVLDNEYAIRAALHKKFLFSSAVVIASLPVNTAIPTQFHIRGGGWGHGVGLCQIGALGMALAGKSSGDILAHYYPSAILKEIYS